MKTHFIIGRLGWSSTVITRLPSLNVRCPCCCCCVLLGYVFVHWLNGSGGGRNWGGLNRCANRDSKVSPPELELEEAYPLPFPVPELSRPPFWRRECRRVGGVGGLLMLASWFAFIIWKKAPGYQIGNSIV